MNSLSLHTATALTSILISLSLLQPATAQNDNVVFAADTGTGKTIGTNIPANRGSIVRQAHLPRPQPSTGLTINATFDASIMTNPNAEAIQACINRVVEMYRTQFKDDVTVSILFRYSTTQPNGSPLGSGSIGVANYVIYSVPWNSYVGGLQSDAKTTADVTANASLPGSALTSLTYVASSNGRAIGLSTPGTMTAGGTIPGGTFDGIVTLNSAQALSFTRPANGNYDAQKVLQHEINEILGMGSYINIFPNVRPADIFSWSSPGTRNLTTSGSRYFSIDGGVSRIVDFNQDPMGDLGDWLSGSCPNPDPYVQNSSTCPGEYADVMDWTPEEITLDVIGYDSTAPVSKTPFDVDGDGRTDLAIYRPAAGEWWYLKSNNGSNGAVQFGTLDDTITPADFTGDGRLDLAFFRPASGFWYVLRSEDRTFFAFPFGMNGDVPLPADYDGDLKADPTIFRPSTATWYISNSSGGTTIQQFGLTTDAPVSSDFDGDGKADIAVFRRAGTNGAEWWLQKSSGGVFAAQFGTASDYPVPSDYTGDRQADIALWRPSTGEWFVLRSQDLTYYAFPFGTFGDKPAPGDYDGDGMTDAAIFRPSTSIWYVNRSTAGYLIQPFGSTGDQPVPSAYIK